MELWNHRPYCVVVQPVPRIFSSFETVRKGKLIFKDYSHCVQLAYSSLLTVRNWVYLGRVQAVVVEGNEEQLSLSQSALGSANTQGWVYIAKKKGSSCWLSGLHVPDTPVVPILQPLVWCEEKGKHEFLGSFLVEGSALSCHLVWGRQFWCIALTTKRYRLAVRKAYL